MLLRLDEMKSVLVEAERNIRNVVGCMIVTRTTDKMYNDLSTAIMLASRNHQFQFDKGGKPYILHCLHVMNTVKSKDPEVLTVAVLHDIVEDTPMTINDLSVLFSKRVVDAIDLITKKEGQSYNDYINGICTNRDAMLVKMADLRHNSDITRIKGLTVKDFERMKKYQAAYHLIKGALKKFPTIHLKVAGEFS